MSNNDLSDFSFRNNSGTAQYSMDNGTTWVNFKNPTGTKSITANGTYDVTDYASASVNVANLPVYEVDSQTNGIVLFNLYQDSSSSIKYINSTFSYNVGPPTNDLFSISYGNYSFTLTAKTTIKRSSYKSMLSPTTMYAGDTYVFPYQSSRTHFYIQKV